MWAKQEVREGNNVGGVVQLNKNIYGADHNYPACFIL